MEPTINIQKSWRKTLSMRFDNQGVLQVKAPKFMLQFQIEDFIKKNKSWIEKHYAKIMERKKEEGKYYLFGKPHPNPPLKERRRDANIQNSMHPLSPWGERIQEGGFAGKKGLGDTDKKSLESYYKKEAHAYIKPRCQELAKKYGFTFASIKINSAHTRWGSCTSKKNLNFSYRLIMTPKDCIDYVIIHELCHLREMNHGARFWKQVSQIMPDYQEKEQHLKEFGWKYKL